MGVVSACRGGRCFWGAAGHRCRGWAPRRRRLRGGALVWWSGESPVTAGRARTLKIVRAGLILAQDLSVTSQTNPGASRARQKSSIRDMVDGSGTESARCTGTSSESPSRRATSAVTLDIQIKRRKTPAPPTAQRRRKLLLGQSIQNGQTALHPDTTPAHLQDAPRLASRSAPDCWRRYEDV